MLSWRSSGYTSFFFAGAATAAGCALRKAAQYSARCAAGADKNGDSHIGQLDDDDHHSSSNHHDSDVSIVANLADQHMPGQYTIKRVEYPWRSDQRLPGITFKYKQFRLVETFDVAPDTRLLRFALHRPDDVFNLPPCSTLQCRVAPSLSPADMIERYYTPVTPNGEKGSFDLIVRKLAKGRMTEYLFNMKPGDSAEFRTLMFRLRYRKNRWEDIGMIAGGTGITPMLQVIRQALPLTGAGNYDPFYEFVPRAASLTSSENNSSSSVPVEASAADDVTRLSLLFCNRSEKHIMLKGYFDKLAGMFPERFKVNYCIDKPQDAAAWKGYTGYVDEKMVSNAMAKPQKGKNILLLCGPDQLIHHLCGSPPHAMNAMHKGLAIQPMGSDFANLLPVSGGVLGKLGYDQDTVYRF